MPVNYSIHEVYEQGNLRWIAILTQKGLCTCGKRVTLRNGQLHHALLSRKDSAHFLSKDRIHHPYNVLMLHIDCHERITRKISLKILIAMYGRKNIYDWYNSFDFKSNFRKLESFDEEF